MNLTLNLALWIAAGLLAAVLLVSSAKLFVPKEKMAAMGAATRWVEDFSPGALKAIGALELLAAAGLILPAVLDIASVLVPVTATCVALLFTGAVIMRSVVARRQRSCPTSSISRWPSSWRGAASAPSPSPADRVRRPTAAPGRPGQQPDPCSRDLLI
jgi:hypothetical protein